MKRNRVLFLPTKWSRAFSGLSHRYCRRPKSNFKDSIVLVKLSCNISLFYWRLWPEAVIIRTSTMVSIHYILRIAINSFMICVCLFIGFIFPGLPLRILQVLNCLNVLAPKFLVKFMDSPDKPRRQIGRRLGFRFWLDLCFWFRFALGVRLVLRFGVGLTLVFYFGLVLWLCHQAWIQAAAPPSNRFLIQLWLRA